MRQSSSRNNKIFTRSALSSFVLLAIAANQGMAAEPDQYQYTIRSTLQYEGIENPLRRPDQDDRKEELAQARITTQLSRTTTRVATNLNYTFARLDYQKDVLQDRSLATGTGSITFVPISDTLTWNVTHNRNMRTIDASLPTTQDNMQVVKTTSTGPTLTTNVGANNQISTSYIYSKSATTFNQIYKQDRGTFNFLAQHRINSSLATGLAYNDFKTTSENNPLAKYDRQIASWNNQYTSEKYQLYADLGYVESISNLESEYVNVDLTYLPVTDTTINLTYQKTVEDMFSNLLYATPDSLIDDGTPSLSTNLAQQYAVERTGISLGHQVANSISYSLQYSTEDRDFNTTNNNQSIDRLGLLFNMPVNDQLSLTLTARDSDLNFERNNRMQHRKDYAITANWLLNSAFSLMLSVNKTKQTGSFIEDDYDTANALIAFTYTFGN